MEYRNSAYQHQPRHSICSQLSSARESGWWGGRWTARVELRRRCWVLDDHTPHRSPADRICITKVKLKRCEKGQTATTPKNTSSTPLHNCYTSGWKMRMERMQASDRSSVWTAAATRSRHEHLFRRRYVASGRKTGCLFYRGRINAKFVVINRIIQK